MSGVCLHHRHVDSAVRGSISSGPAYTTSCGRERLVTGHRMGLGEAVINRSAQPYIPDEKDGPVNVLPTPWWRAGLIAGGLLSVGLSELGMGWPGLNSGSVCFPRPAVGDLCIGVKFPPTERMAAGGVRNRSRTETREHRLSSSLNIGRSRTPAAIRSVGGNFTPMHKITTAAAGSNTSPSFPHLPAIPRLTQSDTQEPAAISRPATRRCSTSAGPSFHRDIRLRRAD